MNEMTQKAQPRSAGNRRGLIFGVLTVAAALIGVANMTWFSTDVVSVLGNDHVISVSGQHVVPALSAAGIVAVAAGVFLALSGKISRYLALVLVVGAGVLALLSSINAVGAPENSIISEVAEQTGVDALTAPVTVHPIAYAGAVLGGALIVSGLVGLYVVRTWGNSSSKYERAAQAGATVHIQDEASHPVNLSPAAAQATMPRDAHASGPEVSSPTTATQSDPLLAEYAAQLSDSSEKMDNDTVADAHDPNASSTTGRPHGEIESDERALWDQLSQGIDPT